MSCHPGIVLPRKEKKVKELWSDMNKPVDDTMNDMEYNLREDIQCLKEDIHELVDALRPFESKIQAMDYATDQHYDKAAELVKRHGEK